jgi:hypothetical protein
MDKHMADKQNNVKVKGKGKEENALVSMHRQTLARGVSVGVDANSLSVSDLAHLASSTNGLKFKSRIKIYNSGNLDQKQKNRIVSAASQPWRIVFS